MRKYLTLLTGLILLLLFSLPALAEDIQVYAELNTTHVQLGETLTLTVTVEGDVASVPTVEIADCQVRYYGPSIQTTIVNGRRLEQASHLFEVTPLKAGTFEVPAIQVKVKNLTLETQTLSFTVSERGQSVTGTAGGELGDYVFIEVVPARQRMYVNEEIPLTINLYVRKELDLRNVHFPEVKLDQFIVQQFPQPEQRTEYRKGNSYNVFPFKTTIRPLTAGTYQLKDVALQTDVLIPRQNRGFGFFTDYQIYTANLVAPEMTLEVLNFPATGKPDEFKGAVGKFKLDVTVNPSEVKVGEPVTIQTRITGTGSFSTVTVPVLTEDSRFKYYDPQLVKDLTVENKGYNEKVYEQVIIPMAGVEVIPAIRFSYFDPESERYVTLQNEPTPLLVHGDTPVSTQVEDYRVSDKAKEVLGQGILYIKANPGRFAALGHSALTMPGLLGYNAVILLVLGGGVFWRYKQSRETPEEQRRKALHAQTQRFLQESEALLKAGKVGEFYNTLYQVIQNYLKERYQITITGISAYEAGHLQKAGLPVKLIEQIREFFRDIDAKRFAGGLESGQDQQQMLERARELIQGIEKGEVA